MRLIFLLLVSTSCYANLLNLAGIFTDDSDQPTQCFGPCTRCRPGLYLGSQFGYAWIDSPTHNDADDRALTILNHQKGSFAWGVFGGYSMRTLQTIYIGVQAGYNNNGHSLLTFQSNNQYKIQSRDWELLGSFTYIFCKCFNLYFKGGVACVKETRRLFKIEEIEELCERDRREYHPTLTAGGGVCVLGLLNLFVQYRGIYAHHQAPLSKAKHISTVHGVNGGLSLLF